MSGIVGLVHSQSESLIRTMSAAITHRGRDESYFFDEQSHVALGVRESKLISDSKAKQPFSDSAGRYVVIFDGHLVNAEQWRSKLQGQGAQFDTKSSAAEVVLRLYEAYGKDMPKMLNGMFAFAIFDREAGTVFGARDYSGMRPLYYIDSEGGFAFATEMKSLFKLSFVQKDLDWQSVWHYFSLQYVPPQRSIFKGVKKLSAGHCFLYHVKSKKLLIRKYWQAQFENAERKTIEEYQETVSSGAAQAIKRWTSEESSIGCALNSSTASAALTASMAKGSKEQIKSWSVELIEEEAGSEQSDLSSHLVEKYRTEHHVVKIKPEDLRLSIDKMVDVLEEPYAGNILPWFIFQSMKDQVDIAVTDAGGETLFGNAGRWLTYQPRHPVYVKQIVERVLGSGVVQFIKHPKGALYVEGLGEAQKERVMQLSASLMKSTPSLVADLWQFAPVNDERNICPFLDFQLGLPEKDLYMLDRFSSAHGIEVRSPFLDKEYIKEILTIPPYIRSRAKRGLHDLLLRESFQNDLPAEYLSQNSNLIQPPVGEWLRTIFREELMEYANPRFLEHQGIFLPVFYDAYVEPHLEGRKDGGANLWAFFMFQKWWFKNVTGR